MVRKLCEIKALVEAYLLADLASLEVEAFQVEYNSRRQLRNLVLLFCIHLGSALLTSVLILAFQVVRFKE